ncbi:hypothetical protein FHR56_000459 [Xanthomonas sacchari]|uniref:hypothetical protein n=1 Tax=unclassified Xanthomonas TaxID=2643310 RepID=UPI0013708892|nr:MULTISPECIES: hypothetical protein [unclassified Xanthomonas]MBB6365346.1 hypothetical protein [Xanthomonas sp. F10]
MNKIFSIFSESNLDHLIKLIERWALGTGIIAAGGALAYLPVIGKAKFLGTWLVTPVLVVGLTLFIISTVQFLRPLVQNSRGFWRWIGACIIVAVLGCSAYVAAITAAEWADNQQRISLCSTDKYRAEPVCNAVKARK